MNIADVTEEDIREFGYEVTFEVYLKRRDIIHYVVTHLDLGCLNSALLQYDFFLLDEGMTSTDCLKRYEAMGNPHLCYMVLRRVAKSATTSDNAVAIDHLKTIVKEMETEAPSRVCNPIQVNCLLDLDLEKRHLDLFRQKNDKENFWPIEQYPVENGDTKQQSPPPLLVCCSANLLTSVPLDDQSTGPTSDTNPGDSLKSNSSYQYQPSIEAV